MDLSDAYLETPAVIWGEDRGGSDGHAQCLLLSRPEEAARRDVEEDCQRSSMAAPEAL
jgi:hypothetical protein